MAYRYRLNIWSIVVLYLEIFFRCMVKISEFPAVNCEDKKRTKIHLRINIGKLLDGVVIIKYMYM